MKDLTDKPSQYVVSYAEALRLDKMPTKRPKKLQCRPGFEQRGAACQKIRPKKAKVAGNNILGKVAVGVIAAGVAGAAGVAALKAAQAKRKPDLDSATLSDVVPEATKEKVREITQQYRRNPTWKIAATAGAVVVGTPTAAFLAIRARHQAGIGESAKIAKEQGDEILKKMQASKDMDIEGGLKTSLSLAGENSFWNNASTSKTKAKQVTFVVNGFDLTDSVDGALNIHDDIKGNDALFDDHHFVAVSNEGFSSIGKTEREVLDNIVGRKGGNPVAVRLAANAYAFHQKYPDLPINLVGNSAAGMATHEAAEILKKIGVDSKVANFGSPYFGMSKKVGPSVTFNNKYDYATEWTPVRDEVHINNIKDHNAYLKEDKVRGMLKDFFDGKEIKGDNPNEMTEQQRKKLSRRRKARKRFTRTQSIPENPFKK